MTSARADLLATIIADPDADAPRLVYADWLEEHGEAERAEFIRVQCRIAEGRLADCTYGCPRGDCQRCQIRQRERDLLDNHGYGLCDGLLGNGWKTKGNRKSATTVEVYYSSDWSTTGILSVQFRRGFVGVIACAWQDWLTHHAAIMQATPLLEVALTTNPDRIHKSISGRPNFADRRCRRLRRPFDREFKGIKFRLPPRPQPTTRGGVSRG